MSERSLSLLLEDIAIAISRILEYTHGMNSDGYESDGKTKDAVERNFEIIGEAASRISDHYKQMHPHIEWRVIKDFRNFIIHEYFGINNQIVWDTIQFRLPDLLKEISLLFEDSKDL